MGQQRCQVDARRFFRRARCTGNGVNPAACAYSSMRNALSSASSGACPSRQRSWPVSSHRHERRTSQQKSSREAMAAKRLLIGFACGRNGVSAGLAAAALSKVLDAAVDCVGRCCRSASSGRPCRRARRPRPCRQAAARCRPSCVRTFEPISSAPRPPATAPPPMPPILLPSMLPRPLPQVDAPISFSTDTTLCRLAAVAEIRRGCRPPGWACIHELIEQAFGVEHQLSPLNRRSAMLRRCRLHGVINGANCPPDFYGVARRCCGLCCAQRVLYEPREFLATGFIERTERTG